MVNLNVLRSLQKLTQDKQAKLIAVSKTRSNEEILDLYNNNQLYFGENKVQELVSKRNSLPNDIEWHMIGHLQRNKVKLIAPFVHMIHAVDSPRLAKEINKQAKLNSRVINVLLQIHIGQEESKFGFKKEEVLEFCKNPQLEAFENIRICGLMGMATFTNDEIQVQAEFSQLYNLFSELKESFFKDNSPFKEISMGMSADYKIALQEGSTMIRVGSALFGSRD